MIVALYKVWRGEEFVEASIESIYCDVGAIVVISSNVGWNGVVGNTVTPVIKRWAKKNDTLRKIDIVEYDSKDQNDQYQRGVAYIREKYKQCSWIMLIDSDEVWNSKDITLAKNKYLKWNTSIPCYKSMTTGYIKKLTYRIVAKDGCQPPIFISPHAKFVGVRGNEIYPSVIMPDVCMHHVTAVRDNDALVFEKFATSTIGDKNVGIVDMDKWKRDVWDNLPNCKNFHYNTGWEHVWASIDVINVNELPIPLRDKKYSKYF